MKAIIEVIQQLEITDNMCLQPVKVVPKRYYSQVEIKGRFIESPLYDGQLYNSNNKYCYYPCGKCFECRESRIESWQIRWKEHIKQSIDSTSYLLTLTYRDSDLTYLNGRSTLNYSDIQKFLKRVRKRQDKYCKDNNIANVKISYHGCGEYGTQFTKRPHYHVLITNLLIPSEEIERIWSHGQVHVGDNVDNNTIKYVLKYTLKSSLENEKKDRVVNDKGEFQYNVYQNGKNKGRVCEKTFCSKGIGNSFLTPELKKYYEDNPNANYLWIDFKKDGTKYSKTKPLPRYFKELIFNPNKRVDGKILRDDYGRPVKLYNPMSEDFESTPRFRRMLVAYQNEQKMVNDILTKIEYLGHTQYLVNVRHEKYEKIRLYKDKLQKRNILQNKMNVINKALLI